MKMITASIHELLTQATAKALATYHNGEVNVVPVSSIKIVDDTIRLVDYFMQKTAINIKHNPYVSLVARKEMIGYQIKGEALYVESGRHFDDACAWVARMHPDRKVKGLIVIQPTKVFDIAPKKDTTEKMKLSHT